MAENEGNDLTGAELARHGMIALGMVQALIEALAGKGVLQQGEITVLLKRAGELVNDRTDDPDWEMPPLEHGPTPPR